MSAEYNEYHIVSIIKAIFNTFYNKITRIINIIHWHNPKKLKSLNHLNMKNYVFTIKTLNDLLPFTISSNCYDISTKYLTVKIIKPTFNLIK